MKRLFLADLHLSAKLNHGIETPTNQHNDVSANGLKHESKSTLISGFNFNHLLNYHPSLEGVEEIYLLGDIFDFWVDWQVAQAVYRQHLEQLTALCQRVKVFFLPGNRDFSLSEADAERIGMHKLTDPYLLNCAQSPSRIVLTHGDTWVADRYHRCFTQIIRKPWLHRLVQKLSVRNKIKIANYLTNSSRKRYQNWHYHAFSNDQTLQVLDQNSSFTVIESASDVIFGHYHRPGHYKKDSSQQRFWQLGDLRPTLVQTSTANSVQQSMPKSTQKSIWALMQTVPEMTDSIHNELNRNTTNPIADLEFVELLIT